MTEAKNAMLPYTSMVHPDSNGCLTYKPDDFGNYVPDFSYAGYMGGGVRLPEVAVKTTVQAGSANDAERIQQAIDEVSQLALDADGFRGAVLLERGLYNLDEPIWIRASGVVLRGEGQDENGTILFGRGAITDKNFGEDGSNAALVFVGGPQGREEMPETAQPIVDEFVPVGAQSFAVANASAFAVGDTVIVRRLNTREWYLAQDLAAPGDPLPYEFDRIVTAVDSDRLTIDVPLTCPIEAQWGGGEIVGYTDSGRIEQVGVENLRGVSDFDRSARTTEYGNLDRHPFIGGEYYCDEDHYFEFVKIDNTRNCWVRDITALHFANSVVYIEKGVKWCTVQDCESLEPVSRCGGGRRFTFNICGQLCLVQRCKSDRGRHSFVLGGRLTCGPNVFLDCSATRPFSSSEPHSSLVVGSLYDNVKAPIALRFAKSNPVRWMGIFNYLWNCEGGFLCQKPPVGQNYAFGQIGIHALVYNTSLQDHKYENGHIESWDEHVEPQCLYLAQLKQRLGEEAVSNIG
jgi:hypothetical protein